MMARASRDFWLLAGSFFICGLSTNGLIGTHLIPAAMDHGYGEVAAAGLLATIGVFDIVGTTASGWLTDRYDPRILLFWYYGLRGLSLLALPYAFGSPHFGLILFIVFYGLDWIATVPPTVALTAEIFGRERVGVIFGWIFCSHMFGAAARRGPPARCARGSAATAGHSARQACCAFRLRSRAADRPRVAAARPATGLGVEPDVLEVDVALHALRDLLGDEPLVPERTHGHAFRVEQFAP